MTDTGTEMSSTPEFERWGAEIDGPRERAPEPDPDRPGISPLRVGAIALVIAAAAALIVALSTGGGGSSHRSASRTSPGAIAAAVNLRLADLPRFHAGPATGVTVGGSPDSAIAGCLSPGGSTPATTGTFATPDYVSGAGLQFSSLESSVAFSTAAALAQQASAAAQPSFAPCLVNALAALTYRVHGLAITSGGGAQATRLPLPQAHSTAVHGLFGERASMTWNVSGLGFPVFVDIYAVAVGGERVTLLALSSEQPYSITAEGRLLATLEGRALANPH